MAAQALAVCALQSSEYHRLLTVLARQLWPAARDRALNRVVACFLLVCYLLAEKVTLCDPHTAELLWESRQCGGPAQRPPQCLLQPFVNK